MAPHMKPEEILIAVIHGLGEEVKIQDDERLSAVFADASGQYPELFGVFAPHPSYGDSERLHEAFQSLIHGGSLVKPNASLDPYIPSKRVLGAYGKSLLDCLEDPQKLAVKEVSKQLLAVMK